LYQLLAQKKPTPNPRATAESDNVSIDYGQYVRRVVIYLVSLLPFDKVWRAGK
jgi:hypothetical protein